MKKHTLIVLLIFISVLVSFAGCDSEKNVPAETTASVETTNPTVAQVPSVEFRGIPFGTPYPEVVETLAAEGIEITNVYKDNTPRRYKVYVDSVDVAGMSMKMLMYFTSMNDPDAPVEDCVLYYGEYSTEISGSQAAWRNVVYAFDSKLTDLYGKSHYGDIRVSSNSQRAEYRWVIGDYTIKIGGRGYNDGSSNYIEISYVWESGQDKAYRNSQEKVPTVTSPNYNGL